MKKESDWLIWHVFQAHQVHLYTYLMRGYRDKKGNTYLGSSRIFLIGYLFGGPQYSANGSLIIETIPTQKNIVPTTPIMVNLGYYVKSTEILSFIDRIKQDCNI